MQTITAKQIIAMDQAALPPGYFLYAANHQLARAYLRVSYNHSTHPQFDTLLIAIDGSLRHLSGHPRTHGITRQNGWSIDPELIQGNW